MQRPDTPDGLFHDGDPATGVKGTPITAAWLNALLSVGAMFHGTANPPSNALGDDGDHYINAGAKLLFGPKAAGVWPAGISFAGATGPTGATGATGNPYKAYASLALATADLANIPADALIWINADTTPANNGYWAKTGGSLVQSPQDRATLLETRASIQADMLQTALDEGNFTADSVLNSGALNSLAVFSGTFSGWGCAFLRPVGYFDLVRLYIQIEDPEVPVRVYVKTSAMVTVCSVDKLIKRSGWHYFLLPRRIDSALIGAEFYLCFRTQGNYRAVIPAMAVNAAVHADTGTYPQKYCTTASAEDSWGNAAPTYPMLVELYRSIDLISRLNATVERVQNLENSAKSQEFRAFFNPNTDFWTGGSFYKWAWGWLPAQQSDISALAFETDQLNYNDHLALKIYKRPSTAAYQGKPSIASGDVLIHSQNFPVAAYQNTASRQAITLQLNQIVTVSPTDIILFELHALTALGANGKLGMGRSDGSWPVQYQRGWYNDNSALGSTTAVSCKIMVRAFSGGMLLPACALPAADLHASLSGLTIDFSGTLVAGPVGSARLHQSLTLDAAASGSATANPYSIIYGSISLFYGVAGAWLGRKHISNVVVTRLSDSAVLAEGTDYFVHPFGKLQGIPNIAAYNASVAYNYALERYDLIEFDPASGLLSSVQGTARDYDAQEYLPSATPGRIPVCYALVVGGAVAELINASLFDKETSVRIGGEGEYIRIVERNRRALAAPLRKLLRGQNISLAGYGDSITALQDNTPAYTANGIYRDKPGSYLNLPFPADTKALFPLYDHGDGAGQVHVHIGWNWILKAYLEARYAVTVNYYNYGLAASNSGNTINNGLWPARIAEPVNAAHDIVVVAFGMNELGLTSTYANVKSICQQLTAAGSAVIVMGVPRPNKYDTRPDYSNKWQITNYQLMKAAHDTGAAFIDTGYFTADNFLGGMRISANSLCATNMYNHPGPYELSRYGELLTLLSGL